MIEPETIREASERANEQLGLEEVKKSDDSYTKGNTVFDFLDKVPPGGLKPNG